jgi:hypothetical protein
MKAAKSRWPMSVTRLILQAGDAGVDLMLEHRSRAFPKESGG